MHALTTHLDKEWREQRRAILVLALVCALAPIAMALVPLPKLLRAAAFAEWVALLAGGLAAIMLASDLVPREVRGRSAGVGFLARVPGALTLSLVAKALMLLIGVGSCSAVGFLIASIVDAARGVHADAASYYVEFGALVVIALSVLPWLFAASTLVARAIWILPLALLCSLGFFLLVAAATGLDLDTYGSIAALLVANWTVALVVAHQAFVRGHRHGPAPHLAARFGATTLAVFALPTLAIAGQRAWVELGIDPLRPDFDLVWFGVEPSGERVIVYGRSERDRPDWRGDLFASVRDEDQWFVVDRATGEFEAMGGRSTSFSPLRTPTSTDPEWSSVVRPSFRYFARGNGDGDLRTIRGQSVWDASEQTDLGGDPWTDLGLEALGGGGWPFLGRGRYEDARAPRAERIVVDPETGQRVAVSRFATDGGELPFRILVRGGAWVVWRNDGYSLYEPTTDTLEPAPELEELLGRSLPWSVMLRDGRLIGRREGALGAFDPGDTGSFAPIAGAEWIGSDAGFHLGDHIDADTPADAPRCLIVWTREQGSAVARLDPIALRIDARVEVERSGADCVWLDGSRVLMSETRARVIEIDFDHGTRRTVFPVR